MVQMVRNVDLESIDSDALFGIDALKNQTILQKLVFFGSLIAGILSNVLLPLFFDVPRILCILIFMTLLLFGVAIGCNYTADMTYGKYFYFFFFKPTKPLDYRSTEDASIIQQTAKMIEAEEEMLLRSKQAADPKEQKILLIKVISFVIAISLLIGGVLIVKNIKNKNNLHHKAQEITQGNTYE